MNPKISRYASFAFGISVMAMTACGQFVMAAETTVTTITVPSRGHTMSAKIDATGVIHLIVDTPDGPQYLRTRDNGKTFCKPIPLLDQSTRKPGLEFITWDMAVTSEGAVHVVLGNNAWKLKLPKDEWGFFYTRLLPDATAFSLLKNINHKPSEGFSLAVSDAGTVTAVWMADKLYANVSHDGGNTFSSTMEIDPMLNPCNCCTTSSVYGADGRLAIFYREETDNNRDMYLALCDQEQNRVTKTRVSTTPWKIDTCPMTYYSVVRNGNGYLTAWPTKGEIFYAKLDANGSPTDPKEIKTSGSSGMRSGVLPIATADGQTLVAWKKDNQLGWQLYDNRGRPMGIPASVASAGTGVAGVASKDGELILFK